MIFDATIGDRTLRVEVRSAGEDGRYTVSLDGEPREVRVLPTAGGFSSLRIGTSSHELGVEPAPGGYRVVLPGWSACVELALAARAGVSATHHAHGPLRLVAPMPGRIVRLLAAPGAAVAAGQGLVVIEAMKMENELRAPRAGRVEELLVREGQAVEAGALLAVVA